MTTMTIGAYRNRNTNSVWTWRRRLPTVLLLTRDESRVDENDDSHQDDQDHRDRRAEGPVTRRPELEADQVPEKDRLVAAQDDRIEVLAHHRDEDEQRAGQHPWKGQRQGDAPERSPGRVAEILRGV